ncbi:MAG: hypothetical protein ACXV95_16770, partial [Acidimicrobiales bacterium]
MRRSLPITLLVAAALAIAVAVGPAGALGVQSTTPVTPFPRSIMAFVGPDRVAAATALDPALAVQSVAVAPGDGVGSEVSRVVTVG